MSPSTTYNSFSGHETSIFLATLRHVRYFYCTYQFKNHQASISTTDTVNIYITTTQTTTMLFLAPLALLLSTALAAPQNPTDITGLLTGALTGLRCVDPNINFHTCRALGGYPDVDITMETSLKLCRCNSQNWVQCEGIEKTSCDGDLVTSICRCSREWVVDLDVDKGCGAPCQCAR
jgi:hypothetical protein